MNNYPIEHVCSLEQAKELAELLGEGAPESLRVWQVTADGNNVMTLDNIAREELVDMALWPAYTGDELGALLKNSAKWKEYSGHATAEEKAALAIEGLKEGWIKKEDFRYG